MNCAYYRRMRDEAGVIQEILGDVGQELSKRLSVSGVRADHVIVAVGPDGHARVHTSLDLNGLKALAKDLTNLAYAVGYPPSHVH